MNKKRHTNNEDTAPEAGTEAQETQENNFDPGGAEASGQMEELLKDRDRAAQERDEYLNLAQRVKADFDNYKRRNQNVREDAYNDGVLDTIGKFLPVLDNLERAAGAAGDEESLREGVQLVLKQLNTVLCAAGIQEIAAEGQAFDPNLHHAVMQEDAEEHESGKVIAVMQKGYCMGSRVLRHCMVKVAK
jgi:molecular chaperone GrpE